MKKIETARLILRPVQFEDLAIYRRLRRRLPDANLFTPPPRPPEKDPVWWKDNIESGKSYMWTALMDKTVVASICAFSFNTYCQGSAEVGVEVLSPDHYGKGIAGEALQPFFKFLKNEGRKVLMAMIIPENVRSIGLFKKLGFSYLDTIKDTQEPDLVFVRMTLEL